MLDMQRCHEMDMYEQVNGQSSHSSEAREPCQLHAWVWRGLADFVIVREGWEVPHEDGLQGEGREGIRSYTLGGEDLRDGVDSWGEKEMA